MRDFATVDFFSEQILSDPFAFYEWARAERPVLKTFLPGFNRDVFVVTTYDLVKEVFQSPEAYSSQFMDVLMQGAAPHPEADALLETGEKQGALLLTFDDPEHKRHRALVATAFTPSRAAAMAPAMEQIINDLIDAVVERGECNFIDDIAVPYPIYVIADVLGYERSIYRKLRTWSDAFLLRLSQQQTPAQDLQAVRSILEFQGFNRQLIDARRAQSRDDLVSKLLSARVAGTEPLTDRELLIQLQEIAVAGNETSRNTLVGGLVLLMREPALIQRLRASPALIPNAVEEIIRLTSPTAGMWRIARHDTVLGGVAIPAGSLIMLRMDSANRDERQFPDPTRVDVDRPNRNQHLAFGSGIHYCLGNFVSRQELTIGFGSLIGRLENLQIIESKSDLTSPPSVLHRSIRALHVKFTPGRRLTQSA